MNPLIPKIEKGPAEVLRALLSGDPDQVAEALEFQRESFQAQFGCYPEETEKVTGPGITEKCTPEEPCPKAKDPTGISWIDGCWCYRNQLIPKEEVVDEPAQ